MIPEHYSRDLVQRCQELIDRVTSHRLDDGLELTFLLAMATPMIVLPVERMMKPMRPHPGTKFETSAVDSTFDFNAELELAWTNIDEINDVLGEAGRKSRTRLYSTGATGLG